MRKNKHGNIITLEQDIKETWKLHGLEVIQEKVYGDTWEIKAEPIKNDKKN